MRTEGGSATVQPGNRRCRPQRGRLLAAAGRRCGWAACRSSWLPGQVSPQPWCHRCIKMHLWHQARRAHQPAGR